MNTPRPAAERARPSASDSPFDARERAPLAPAAPAPPPSAVAAPPDERRILTLLGETKRVGRWRVPRLLRVRALLGEVWIDLRDSAIPEDFVLDLRAYGTRVTLVVPPGIDVAFDVFVALGNAKSQAHEPVGAEPRAPAIRVLGSALLGEVRVLVRERGA